MHLLKILKYYDARDTQKQIKYSKYNNRCNIQSIKQILVEVRLFSVLTVTYEFIYNKFFVFRLSFW